MTDGSFQIGWTTYTPLTGAEPVDPRQHGTRATATDATDLELAELRRRVVDPVVASVLTADELDSVTVFEDPSTHAIRVRVQARGEVLLHWVQMERALPVDDPVHAAARFADELENFAAESDFGWGVQRIARYVVPPAPTDSSHSAGSTESTDARQD